MTNVLVEPNSGIIAIMRYPVDKTIAARAAHWFFYGYCPDGFNGIGSGRYQFKEIYL